MPSGYCGAASTTRRGLTADGKPGTVNGMKVGLAVCCVLSIGNCETKDDQRAQIEVLQTQVDALRRELESLRKELHEAHARPTEADGASGERNEPMTADDEESAREETPSTQPVVLRITTEPADALVHLDGFTHESPVELTRSPSTKPIDLRIEHGGFRTLQQAVVLDRDRDLKYRLTPGRGLEQRPTTR